MRDDAIAPLSASLPWSGQLALHASGATELDALASAVRRAGFHPLQLFADPLPTPEVAHAAFAGIHIGIEAGDEFDALAQLAVDLSAKPLRLRAGQRARYHAAANMAASGLFAPLQRAAELWSGALDLPGDQAWVALQPLAAGALRAAGERGLAAALSGPLARGDAGVLARHLEALKGDAAEPLYRELMRSLLPLAQARLAPRAPGSGAGLAVSMSRHWSSVLPLVAGLGVSAPALALEFSGLLDLRATATNTARSWTEEGSGKTRYDRSGAALRLGQALLRAEGDVGEAVRATLVGLNAYDDRSQLIDVSEAFLHWRPLPAGPWRSRVRLGAFFPASSLEIDYDDIGWTPTRTLSSSAINSWIGEEIRPVGVEYDLLHKGLGALEGHRFGLSAALFGGSDPAGTLLAWRGWSVGDRITGLSEPLRLPDLPVLRPGAELAQQDRNLRIGRELDDRLGYYAAARYAYREVLELAALRYDSRGDPLRLREGQYSWDTRFNHFGQPALAA